MCGASFPDRPAGVTHALSHVGVQLFTCDMCHLQFCSQNKLLRHHRQTASTYTIPQGALSANNQGLSSELQCAVCTKTLGKDFQVGRTLVEAKQVFLAQIHQIQSSQSSRNTCSSENNNFILTKRSDEVK